jgi:hypothetical protein
VQDVEVSFVYCLCVFVVLVTFLIFDGLRRRREGRTVTLDAKVEKPVEPNEAVDRPPCPFFGFSSVDVVDMMMDQQGNQCALLIGIHSPCAMSVAGERPDWSACRCTSEDDKAKLISGLILRGQMVGALEFWPKDERSWSGLPFGEWWTYVMLTNRVGRS